MNTKKHTPSKPVKDEPIGAASATQNPATPAERATQPVKVDPNTEHRKAPPDLPLPISHIATVAAIALLAFLLRLRDPLSSNIIGAEDPYLHMARTWDLVQGKGVHDYPLGFMILLSPLTLLGPDTFYAIMRWVPPVFGAAAVVGVFLLCRRYVHPTGAFAAALLVAVLREHIMRTNLFVPTALDLAVIPFVVLALLRGMEGARWGLPTAGGLLFALFLVHPWVVALMLPPVALFFLIYTVRTDTRRWAAAMAGGSIGMFLLVVIVLQGWKAFGLIFNRAMPQVGQLLSSPGSMPPLPEFVDLPWMLTVPVLLLALCGAGVAVWRRTRLAVFALIWSLLLLPLVLVDWLGMSFLPHRTVVYLSFGLVILAALPVAEMAKLLETARPNARIGATAGILGVVLLLTLPAALATEPWKRIYDDQDFQAWDALDARGTDYLVAGSWQSRAGYRSLTAREAVFMPAFFEDERQRGIQVDAHPGLVVLIDKHTKGEDLPEEQLPTDFLSSWVLVGEWGDKQAYTPS
jgi:hypothetical protein